METVSDNYKQELKELARSLVTPERYGKVALRLVEPLTEALPFYTLPPEPPDLAA